jgi:hypothetical protein
MSRCALQYVLIPILRKMSVDLKRAVAINLKLNPGLSPDFRLSVNATPDLIVQTAAIWYHR